MQLLQYETLADKRIVVAIDSWEADSLYPSGHYTRTLGPIGDRDTETEVRLSTSDGCLFCAVLPSAILAARTLVSIRSAFCICCYVRSRCHSHTSPAY